MYMNIIHCDAIRSDIFFCSDVVLNSVNMASRDEDSISDQIYEKLI